MTLALLSQPLVPPKTDQQDFHVVGTAAGDLHSRSFFDAVLTIQGTKDSLTVPVQTCTTVGELRTSLAIMVGYIEPSLLGFVVKRGCTFKRLHDSDQVQRQMTVTGIKKFAPQEAKYPHPYGIIGAGYLGIKTSLFMSHYGRDNYVVFDRYDRAGGHCWLEMANKTTRLQTEFPTFHVWYGREFSMPGMEKCGGAPKDFPIWPTRDELLQTFDRCVEDFGLAAHMRFKTNVEDMEVVGKETSPDRYYLLTCRPVEYERKDVQGGGALAHQVGQDGVDAAVGSSGKVIEDAEPYQVKVSCLCQWPGALVYPRPVVYKGEEEFGGKIDYAVEMRFDYSHVVGKTVVIHGHGAFTMENIRTCLEYGSKKMYVLCRKMNLTCPRAVSWFINQSNPPIPAAHILDCLQDAYMKHIHIDPWTLHSVQGNAARSTAHIKQKTRFGIGDVYFLSSAYGLMELKIGNIKRCSYKTLHLEDGSKLECDCVLKCTGCLADWKVDKLLKIREMRHNWVNGDFRRCVTGEADGIDASSFASTTAGPGYYQLPKAMIHFWDCPAEYYQVIESGLYDQLPVHKAGEPNEEFPAYFFGAKHAANGGIMLAGACPLMRTKMQGDDDYKNFIEMHCIPLERIIKDAKEDWEHYEKHIRDKGMVPKDAPYVPYLYDEAYWKEQFERQAAFVQKKYGA
mmetsp:Transcript_24640/g.56883  ORF Transcript_24640/g.56883 Transcript_24640/m.56883 type:complete len:678 (-) Transcript_24640:33-2066(-)